MLNRAVARHRGGVEAEAGGSRQQSARLQQRTAEGAEAPASSAWDTRLYLPPWVPAGEALQVEQRLDAWVTELLQVFFRAVFPLFLPL